MAECTFGNKATFSISGGFTGTAAVVQQIGGLRTTRAVADVTPLDAADGYFRKKKVSNLIDHEAFTVTVYFNPETGFATNTEGTATITFPEGETLAGAARIVEEVWGDMVSDEISIATFTVQFIGGGASAITRTLS